VVSYVLQTMGAAQARSQTFLRGFNRGNEGVVWGKGVPLPTKKF